MQNEAKNLAELAPIHLTAMDVKLLESIVLRVGDITNRLYGQSGEVLQLSDLAQLWSVDIKRARVYQRRLLYKGCFGIWESGDRIAYLINRKLFEIPRDNGIFDRDLDIPRRNYDKRIKRPDFVAEAPDWVEEADQEDAEWTAIDVESLNTALDGPDKIHLEALGIFHRVTIYMVPENQWLWLSEGRKHTAHSLARDLNVSDKKMADALRIMVERGVVVGVAENGETHFYVREEFAYAGCGD